MELFLKIKSDYFDMYKTNQDATEMKVLKNTLKTLAVHLEPMVGCDDATNANHRIFRVSNDGGSKRYEYMINAIKGLRCVEDCYTK